MDWVKQGTTMKVWVYPPKFPTDEEIATFSEQLKETIPSKLTELYERRDEVVAKCNRLYKSTKPLPQKRKIYFRTWAAALYEEVLVIDKWVLYWLTINAKLTNKKLPEVDYGFSKLEIERAKQKPFEWFFPTELEYSSKKRKVGLCPFHVEKTPSFTVYLESNSGHCFGCSWSGDVIAFQQRLNNIKFSEAVRRLL